MPTSGIGGSSDDGHGHGGFAATVFLFLFLLAFSDAQVSGKMGINYGQLGSNLPSPYQSIQILKSINASRVKLYNADPEILRLLAGSKIQVSIMVPNQEIIRIASDQTLANQWVRQNVLQYYPNTMIRFILVGNEIFSSVSVQEQNYVWPNLVPAMRNIKNSLKIHNIKNIKVGTPLSMDILQTTFPPSNGTFRTNVSILPPLLKFLNGTKSYFFIDVYPYFSYSADPTSTSLEFCLFRSRESYTDPANGLVYSNMLDQMLDSVIFAMSKLGYPNIQLAISETGWPSGGDIDQAGANIHNAATYNRNLVKKMTANPPMGTPARPGTMIPTFIFSLYNENRKDGPGTERHWGVFNENGKAIYDIDLSGQRQESEYEPLPEGINNRPYKGKLWCVVRREAGLMEVERELSTVCSQGNETCEALAPGNDCYEPISVIWHASYAFSSYWAQFRSQGASCYFNGLAKQTTTDPSHGSCKFPSVTV
ncbi:hypothetical protein JCGZ_13143 [Jatropha curcas]|uniref:glucan endo-1,3-beta-D-glucosidase n=1 Tax=Jatropha curcas TaxID=180498 RepID=A0A067KC45_JATCU|nr:probable glucan endo-1,3-beta-glucosidase A6 [Jatropha curcas]KDP32593.1 hypothetical protein JCGZ_13143 [Jatropha curcas]